MRRYLFAGGALVAFTLLGFFFFPGHTYLQSDTQIYVPMLERLWDPSVLARDPLATRPHVSFTVYDEVAIALRWLTGCGFQAVLVAQQLVFRFLGLLGVFLMATALRLSVRAALVVAGVFALGATIVGPSVLSIEYEPVPRGFAVPLIMLGVGLAAHGRDVLAGCAASLAFLYHAPTAAPFWAVYFLLTLWPSNPEIMKRRIRGLAPLVVAVLLMLVLSRLQPGVSEAQELFGRISPEHEQLQRFRASYNWISIWIGAWFWQYVFLVGVVAAALWRVWRVVPFDLKWFWVGLPAAGILSVPLSYLLLERLKWTLIPQFQPGRAVLFVTAFVVIGGSAAAAQAALAGRRRECFLWLLPALAVPIQPRVLELLLPDVSSAAVRVRLLTLLVLAALMTLALAAEAAHRRWTAGVWAVAAVLPFWMIPNVAGTANYPPLHSPELAQLSSWAHASTPKDALFLFPDAGRDLYPGVFRAQAIRAVYTDWKAGGQVNYHHLFADEWRSRWQTMMEPKFDPAQVGKYTAAGIDYIIVKPANRRPGITPAFQNAKFVVYRIPDSASTSARAGAED